MMMLFRLEKQEISLIKLYKCNLDMVLITEIQYQLINILSPNLFKGCSKYSSAWFSS